MKRIILNLDKGLDTQEHINEDISTLRDTIQTIVREYHTHGDTKYEHLERYLARLRTQVSQSQNSVELIKNNVATFEKELLTLIKEGKISSGKIKKAIQKFEEVDSKIADRVEKIERDYQEVVKVVGGEMSADDFNVASLSIRVANMKKRLDALEGKEKRGFLGLFRRNKKVKNKA